MEGIENKIVVTWNNTALSELEIKIGENYYTLEEIEFTATMNKEGYGKIKIDSYKAFFINQDDDNEEIKLRKDEIEDLENELKEFYDWETWITDQEPDPDRDRD